MTHYFHKYTAALSLCILITAPIISLISVHNAFATTVLRTPLNQLAQQSALIIHAVVHKVDDNLFSHQDLATKGRYLTAIELEVIDQLKGDPISTLRLVVPGGRSAKAIMKIPGMPLFNAGEEVVLLLEKTRNGYIFTGLGQGVFRVQRKGTQVFVNPDTTPVHLIDKNGDSTDLKEPVKRGVVTPLKRDHRATLLALKTILYAALEQPSPNGNKNNHEVTP